MMYVTYSQMGMCACICNTYMHECNMHKFIHTEKDRKADDKNLNTS